MFRFLKELYLTGFTLGFKFAHERWTPLINLGKGVAGVTLFEAFIFMEIAVWIAIYFGMKSFFDADKWTIGAIFMALCAANHYILVIRGHGIKFEREFSNLEKSKKSRLLASCAVLMLANFVFFIYSVSAYHRFFHIVPKTGW
jgi:hypothetical protein